MTGVNIGFPKLGIFLENIQSGFKILGVYIAFYGLIIALGGILGYLVAEWQAKRTGQNPELYLDFALIVIPLSVIGARIFFVVFNWDIYQANPLNIFNLKKGGLAIYGGVIIAIISAYLFSRVKKIKFGQLADTGVLGLMTGQIIGRWGNFFNCEAFGGYAGDSLLAMKLPWEVARSHMSLVSALAMEQYVEDGSILVHPTFLYESLWNTVLLILFIFYTKHKKFEGEIFLLYLAGYGLGRFWIENLRTDQLFLWNTQIPVSMLLSILLMMVSIPWIIRKRLHIKRR